MVGDMAEPYALRAYEAIDLAAAIHVGDEDLVVVAGDRPVLDAASALGLAVAATS